jgi:hypothetical protein
VQVRAPRELTDEQAAAKAAAKESKESKQAEMGRQQAAVDAVLADKVRAACTSRWAGHPASLGQRRSRTPTRG